MRKPTSLAARTTSFAISLRHRTEAVWSMMQIVKLPTAVVPPSVISRNVIREAS